MDILSLSMDHPLEKSDLKLFDKLLLVWNQLEELLNQFITFLFFLFKNFIPQSLIKLFLSLK